MLLSIRYNSSWSLDGRHSSLIIGGNGFITSGLHKSYDAAYIMCQHVPSSLQCEHTYTTGTVYNYNVKSCQELACVFLLKFGIPDLLK